IWQKSVGPEHPDFASALFGKAQTYVSQQDYRQALTPAKRALAISEKVGAPSVDLAEKRYVLAKILVKLDTETARARSLAKQAADDLRKLGSHPDDLAEVEAWIRSTF